MISDYYYKHIKTFGGGMFGLSDNSDKNNQAATSADTSAAVATPPADNSAAVDNTAPEPPVVAPAPPTTPEVPAVAPAPTPTYDSDVSNPAPVLPGPTMSDVSLNNAYIPTNPQATNTASSTSSPAAPQPTASSLLNNVDEEGLIKLKQQALQSLAPLMDHLEQTPEEKFKTTMMLIQASDNSELIQEAFDAANRITDEKVRAQALLDVVNEINYFTHHSIPPSEQSV